MAALGTPDPGTADDGATTCNTSNRIPGVGQTGSRSSCVSDVGAFDMVGNIDEWVADWVPWSTCDGSWLTFSDDRQGLCGAAVTGGPGVLRRGGYFSAYTSAGVFAVDQVGIPWIVSNTGFRCAR